ncbi:MAG: methylmalonyl-CoA carboxyltransferase [Dehalococcoidia bacterium]|nr:methylmalonyl-CoA carboxyltransferase [Dehalococcoidia bacterium]
MTAPAAGLPPEVAELRRRRAIAHGLGGPERVQRQHDRGFLTARERVELLLDPGSQVEFGQLVHSGTPGEEDRTIGDGRLVGFGTVGGRPIAYTASDATIKGASGSAGSRRRGTAFHRIVEEAALPTFDLSQGGGARITEIMTSRFAGYFGAGMGRRLAFPRREALFIAVMGNYYAPWMVADSDYSVMTRGSNISISSPPVVEEATGMKIDPFELGGAAIHERKTGQVDTIVPADADAVAALRHAFAYLPGNAWEDAPVLRTGDSRQRTDPALREIVPVQPNRAYDVKRVIRSVFDRDSFLEWAPEYGKNLVCGIARLDGHTVAVIANQPMQRAGALDKEACIKIARTLTACDRFRIPLVSFIDVPGVLPTPDQEHRRLLTHVYGLAIQRLTVPVPKVSVFMHKAFGYALWGMSGADHEWYHLAWPTAQIAFMGAEPGVRVAFRREWEAAANQDAWLLQRASEVRRMMEPWEGAECGYLDNIIDPAETRPQLVRALEISRRRMRWHRTTG